MLGKRIFCTKKKDECGKDAVTLMALKAVNGRERINFFSTLIFVGVNWSFPFHLGVYFSR